MEVYKTPDELSHFLGCSPKKIKAMIRDGHLNAINIGTLKRPTWKISQSDIDKLIKDINERGYLVKERQPSINDFDLEDLKDLKTEIIEFVEQNDNGCWNWLRRKNNQAYGLITLSHKNKNYTFTCHRVAYRIWKGIITNDQWVLHKCHNPCCCNPEHLYLGSPKQNANDRWGKRRGLDHLDGRRDE